MTIFRISGLDYFEYKCIRLFIQIANQSGLDLLNNIQSCMNTQAESLSSFKSANLSLKLLNTICPVQNKEFKRSITSFQQLSNRLSMANQKFNNNKFDHQTAKQWFYDKGVNISNVQIIAKQVKKQKNIQRVKKVEKVSWQSFQYDKFNHLDLQNYLHQSEERTAHLSIMNSFSTNNASNHMDKLRSKCLKPTIKKNVSIQEEQDSRSITDKQVISQLIRNYQQSSQYGDPKESSIHKIIQKVLDLDRFAWFRILYYQIQMVQYLKDYEGVNTMNYILTTSLKELQKQAKQAPEHANDFWKSVFLQYRRGGIDFRHTNNHFDLQLLQNLKKINHQVNHYEQLSNQSSIDLNKKDHPAQRILKLIALGNYQIGVEFDCKVDEAWMIILSVALKRSNKTEKQQRTVYKTTVQNFISRIIRNNLKNDNYLDQILTSLTSLGAYEEILNIYKYLNENNSLSSLNRILFIQIFILVASKVQLIQSFNDSQTARSLHQNTIKLIKLLVLQICYFTETFKNSNKNLYFVLLTIVTEILSSLQQFSKEFKQLPVNITKILRLSIDDLQERNFSYLSELSSNSVLAKNMFENVLINAQLQTNSDYLRLADLCVEFKTQNLIQPIFIKFIIVSLLQSKHHQGSSLDENQEIMQEILDKLNHIITNQNQEIYNFLISFIELKTLTKLKKVDELSAKRKGFQTYLLNENLIRLLIGFCEKGDERLLDIYVKYYQQIYSMYKIIYLAMNSMSQLRKKSNDLVTQLQKLQKQYPQFKSPKLGKLIVELKR